MKTNGCANPVALATLIDYWQGELDQADESRLEEHLLGCGDCTASAQQLAELAEGIRFLFGGGLVRAVVSEAFLERATARGVRLREYTVPKGGSINCTIGPEDELLVARLEAPLADVEQLDLLMLDTHGKGIERARDVPFNPATGQVILNSSITDVRALSKQTSQIRLLAIGREGEQVIGEYTFHHSPWQSS